MTLEHNQIIAILINASVLLVSILATVILVWKLKFEDKNARLLFILFILFWMSPLLCREYTGQMHLHMYYVHDYGTMFMIPLLAYGIIGLIWRPLNDVMAFRMQSRKNVIFISLGIQAAFILPFMIYPCFTTNIIQSVGAGIGASGIGLFSLMFTNKHHHKRIFKTVSIIALPPLIAELITSATESLISSFLPESAQYQDYTEVMIVIWVVAIAAIIASFIVTIFVKEPKTTLFTANKFKEPVKKAADWWVVILICIAAACAIFIRFVNSGPASVTQLIYMGENAPSREGILDPLDTRFFEGYLTWLFSLGSLLGLALSGLWLSKAKSKTHPEKIFLSLIATVLWIVYLVVNSNFPTVRVFFWTTLINGLAYGLIWNLLIGMILNKFFTRTNAITPIGLLNTFLSLGICAGTVVNAWFKGPAYDFEAPQAWAEFVEANAKVNNITIGITALFFLSICVAYLIHLTWPPEQKYIRKSFKTIGETEV